MPANDPFDCQEFHELCMDYRGAQYTVDGNGPQACYEKLQAYCRKQMNKSYNDGWNSAAANEA